jgi:hypothetical protein
VFFWRAIEAKGTEASESKPDPFRLGGEYPWNIAWNIMRTSDLISLRIVQKRAPYKPHLGAFTVLARLEAESFPLVRYTAAMHPPRVNDAEVRAVIRELTVENIPPAGAAVRRALESRFGSRGGVTRIYRLLAEEGARLTSPPNPSSVEALQRELQAMRHRAERAEHREVAHQTRWAEEVDRLRRQVAALEPVAQQARIGRDTNELLRHQLQAAELRAAKLEAQLMASQEGEEKGVAVANPSETLATVRP